MLAEDKIEIVDFQNKYKEYFKSLNEEWITNFFEIEENDTKYLNNPEKLIIEKGGAIKFALLNNQVVGTCALVKIDHNSYELAKMAVSPKAQGKKIGYYLGIEILKQAKKLGAEKVILLSNKKLGPAINLYKKLGFKEVEISKEDADAYKRVDIRMEINLQDI